jgi:hypothetical protein
MELKWFKIRKAEKIACFWKWMIFTRSVEQSLWEKRPHNDVFLTSEKPLFTPEYIFFYLEMSKKKDMPKKKILPSKNSASIHDIRWKQEWWKEK